jgi:hypothetical protein
MSADTPRDGAPALPAPSVEGQQWAIERRLGEIFGKLGEKLADLTGRVEVMVKPETSFTDIGGLTEAKGIVRSFVTALTDPELYRKWGITPPKGMLIYGPPGTGKTLLARAGHRGGGRLLPPEARHAHVEVRPEYRRAAAGDPGPGPRARQGCGLPGSGRRARAGAPPAAGAGPRGGSADRGGAL